MKAPAASEANRRRVGGPRPSSGARAGSRPGVARERKTPTSVARPIRHSGNRRRPPAILPVREPSSTSISTSDPENGETATHRVAGMGVRAAAAVRWSSIRGSASIAIKVCLVGATVVAAVALGGVAERYVRSAEAFATKTIEVKGTERLGEEEIVEAARLRVGQNIFDVAPEEARAHLLEHPWIAEAVVRRDLPDAYSVQIRERRAVALLLMDQLYLVGRDGTVFKRAESEDELDYPVVTGLDQERFSSDRVYRASVVLEVVALMHDYRGAGLWRSEPISEVHIGGDDSLSLYVGDDGMRVRLGRGPFGQKLHRLRRVLDRLREEGLRAEYIYVDNVRRSDRVTVKIRELPESIELATADDQ